MLVAPPGSGKTTRVPIELLAEPWLGSQRILMLEPRRVAARSAAQYMASGLGEPVGETVGYRTRGDSRVGRTTRIEVVTERLLTRRLQRDPALDGVGLVVFDEVHERSLDTDLGLALCLDVVEALRPDLRLLAMSATPDVDATASLLAGRDPVPAPVVRGVARPYEVETIYVGRDHRRQLEDEVAEVVLAAIRDSARSGGDLLVFLPGRREIRQAARRLADRGVATVALTAGLSARDLDVALRRDPHGARRVVLATSVAQTSLTIDGVSVVIDSGLERSERFDPGRGLGGLVTVPASVAVADQRRGRAGRQGPGRCYRLWTRAEHDRRPEQSEPEIRVGDLCTLALDLAAWGVTDPGDLRWITPPAETAWKAATSTLHSIGVIDDAGRITPTGRRVADLGAHPRLGVMMLAAVAAGDAALGARLAAVIEAGARGDLAGAVERLDPEIERQARRWTAQLPATRGRLDDVDGAVAALVATAFPERVARRRAPGGGRFLAASGTGFAVEERSPLGGAEWLAIAGADRVDGADHRVVSAVPLSGEPLERLLEARLERRADITVSTDGVIAARSAWFVGAIEVRPEPGERAPDDELIAAAARFVAEHGLSRLAWSAAARELQARLEFARRFHPELPDCSDAALAARSAEWLSAHVRNGAVALGTIRAGDVIAGYVTFGDRALLDEVAPVRCVVPSGRGHTVVYGPEGPSLHVKLQEMFGAIDTPTVARGRVPITLHLLSPAGRPLQVTQDLASFWAGSYRQVRAEMRGRYPKHPWPEDPLAAEPTSSTRRRGQAPGDRNRST